MQIEPWPDAYEAVKAICNLFVKSCRFNGFGQGRICPTTADNLVPVVGETSRRNSTDVAKPNAPILMLRSFGSCLQIMPPRTEGSQRPNRAYCLPAGDGTLVPTMTVRWYTSVIPPRDATEVLMCTFVLLTASRWVVAYCFGGY
jgi:hypothetical protein